MEKLKLYGKKVKIKERDKEIEKGIERKKELTSIERIFLEEYYSWPKKVRDEFLKKHSKGGRIKIKYLNGKGEMEFDMKKLGIERALDREINKEVFLGTIYVNEKKEIVIDVKDPQLKKDLLQEINKELSEYDGIRWPKTREDNVIHTKEGRRELKEKLELFLKKDKKFEKDLEKLKNLWRKHTRLSIRKEKLLNKKNQQKKEIEEIKKKIKEIEEKINKKMMEEELFWKLREVGTSAHEILFVILGLGCEKPNSPLFLSVLRNHLTYSREKYGRYVLSRMILVEED